VGEGAQHYVFTDGLASVSFYIELNHGREPVLKGFSRIGATEAFGLVRDGYQLVAVGEVPRATLRQIVHTAEPR
jgi:Negative regulator of sigma E activity